MATEGESGLGRGVEGTWGQRSKWPTVPDALSRVGEIKTKRITGSGNMGVRWIDTRLLRMAGIGRRGSKCKFISLG